MSSTLAVELRGIGKRFPGVIANYDVDLNVRSGTIHAVVGENGAGKSTLMKTLYGMQEPDSGTISVQGSERRFKSPSDAISAGIGMVHQHFMLADNLTVLENIILGSEPGRRGVIDMKQARSRVEEIMSLISSELDPDVPVSELGVGERQRVEIIKVLYRGARILILDEPTAVLVPEEVDELFATLNTLVSEGATVIFISHKLDEVLQVSDDITVMRQGTTVAETTPQQIDRSGLAELMVGSELPSPAGRTSTIGDNARLAVNGLTVAGVEGRPAVDNASLTVRAGEIVGIAGVEGNGQYELCAALLGLLPSKGTVAVDGKDLTKASTRQRHDAGLAYIPFDRHREGLMLNASLWENTLLGREDEDQFSKGPLVDTASIRSY
ncbi:MAG: ABC transporter ATP-binding protein, partial [Ilumatobacteraceae bacterium]